MPSNIINLRQVRKRKARATKEMRAAENRAKFGQPKPQRTAAKLEDRRLTRALDGARLGDASNEMSDFNDDNNTHDDGENNSDV